MLLTLVRPENYPLNQYFEQLKREQDPFHEGDLSREYGFFPQFTPVARLPAAFAKVDQLANEFPALLENLGICRRIKAMIAITDAFPNDKAINQLDRQELSRACIIYGHIAHLWAFENQLQQTEQPLPEHIMQSWQLISKRSGRPITGLSLIDYAYHNWQKIDHNGPVEVENLQRLIPIAGEFDRVSYVAIAEIEMKAKTLVAEVLDMEEAIVDGDEAACINCINAITRIIFQMCDAFLKINHQRLNTNCVNQLAWYLLTGDMAAPFYKAQGELGFNGVASATINLLDVMMDRRFETPFGQSQLKYRQQMTPKIHQQFIAKVDALKLTSRLPQTDAVKFAWQQLGNAYFTFHELHRIKIYGTLIMAFEMGRGGTNGGFTATSEHAVSLLNEQFLLSIGERFAKLDPYLAGTVSTVTIRGSLAEVKITTAARVIAQPGDLLYLKNNDGDQHERCYSVSKVDSDGLFLTVKTGHAGKTSTLLSDSANIANSLRFRLVKNTLLSLPKDSTVPLLFFAAGSGIAPFIGACKADKNMMFLSIREEADIPYIDDLPDLLYINISSQGVSITDLIKQQASEIIQALIESEAKIYICGGYGFVTAVLDSIALILDSDEVQARRTITQWIQAGRIHQEVFPSLSPDSHLPNLTQNTVQNLIAQDKTLVVIDGDVYDLSDYHDHPGGSDIFTLLNGQDVSKAFHDIHYSHHHIIRRLECYKIGRYIASDGDDVQCLQQYRQNRIKLIEGLKHTALTATRTETKTETKTENQMSALKTKLIENLSRILL